MWRKYRDFQPGEFILVAADTSSGLGDYSAAQFLSKTNLDVPLVYHSKTIATEMTNALYPVLEKINDITGKRPVFEQIDCKDINDMDLLFTKHKDIVAIIHFAASKAVGESVIKPLMYYRNNLKSMLNIMELMIKHNVENLVFSSSCTIYGQPDILPVTEKAEIKLNSVKLSPLASKILTCCASFAFK